MGSSGERNKIVETKSVANGMARVSSPQHCIQEQRPKTFFSSHANLASQEQTQTLLAATPPPPVLPVSVLHPILCLDPPRPSPGQPQRTDTTTTLALVAFRLQGLPRSLSARLRRQYSAMAQAQTQAAGDAPPKKQKLFGRAFYESIGSPKHVVAPMVDQSEFVSAPSFAPAIFQGGSQG